MDSHKLTIIHEHYRDTCSVLNEQRASRDRYFYAIVAVLAVITLDLGTPDTFADAVAAIAKAKLGLSALPDLVYVRSLIFFLLCGLTIRYCQAALGVERQYDYVHATEALLARHMDESFSREGLAYLKDYPAFLTWTHNLYTVVFPLLLASVSVTWAFAQATSPGALRVNLAISIVLFMSLALYLSAVNDRRKAEGQKGVESSRNSEKERLGREQ